MLGTTERIYNDLIKIMDCTDAKERIVPNAPMKEYTTFHIGGPADVMIFPSSKEELAGVMAYLRERGVPVTVIGNGSNVLVRDGGIRGAVIKIDYHMSGIKVENENVYAQSGALLSAVAAAAAAASLGGMEFSAGIPGSAGGAVFMNAGAYGGEMKNIVKSCKALLPDGSITEFQSDEIKMGYRTTVFSENGGIITSCVFALQKADKEEIYEKMKDLAARRIEKQPLNMPSAGSTFKRPPGHFAGKLIQDSGCRGLSVGGARVSQKHAGFIVNENDATAKDVMDLIKLVQMRVKDVFGVDLMPEVRIIGED